MTKWSYSAGKPLQMFPYRLSSGSWQRRRSVGLPSPGEVLLELMQSTNFSYDAKKPPKTNSAYWNNSWMAVPTRIPFFDSSCHLFFKPTSVMVILVGLYICHHSPPYYYGPCHHQAAAAARKLRLTFVVLQGSNQQPQMIVVWWTSILALSSNCLQEWIAIVYSTRNKCFSNQMRSKINMAPTK